jgi:hypothetical protein
MFIMRGRAIMKKLCATLATMLLLLALTGCKDNPYKAFDPEGVLVNGYLGLHESETKLPEDKSFKKSEMMYQKHVRLFDKNYIFSYSKHGYIINGSKYIYYSDINPKEQIIEFTLKAYKELTSALGAPKQIDVSKFRKEDEYLTDIDEAIMLGLYDYVESRADESLLLSAKWEKDNRHIVLLVRMQKGLKMQYASISFW